MNTRIASTLLLVLWIAGCASAPPTVAPIDTSSKPRLPYVDRDIEGVWVIKSGELGGAPFKEPGFQLWIKGDRFAVEVPSPPDRGRLLFHHQQAANEPLGLDMIVEEGPNQGRAMPSIYRLVNGELEICTDLSGRGRPVEFATREGTDLFRVTYRRRQ